MERTLLKNGTVLAWNDELGSTEVLRETSVLIIGDEIAALVPTKDDRSYTDAATVIDMTGKIICPGFVNTHCHMWQTAFRSMAPDIFIAQYFGWLSQMGQATRSFSGKDVYISCVEGYCEGINAGVTSFVDHASTNWHEDMIRPSFDAAVDAGARVWWCYDVNTRGQSEEAIERQVEALRQIKVGVADNLDLDVSLGLAFDGFDLSDSSQVEKLKKVSRAIEAKVLTTHFLGGPWPVGTLSPSMVIDCNIHKDTNPCIIFSHAGFVTDKDVKALLSSDAFIAITPENEMSEGHGQPRSRQLHSHAALGTDTNWNISGDVLLQARIWLQSVRSAAYEKTLDRGLIPNASPMSVLDAFHLATRQGGLALHRDDIGVLKVGAKADIVCFRGDSPNMLGWSNPIAAIMLHSNVGDIEHVLVGGRFRKRDGVLLPKSRPWEDIKADFTEAARRIQQENAEAPGIGEKFLGFADYGEVETFHV